MTYAIFIWTTFLVLTTEISSTVLDKNKCSKFDYEYKVLERIIFMENKNAELEKNQVVFGRKNEKLEEIVKEQRLEMERMNDEQKEDREKLRLTVTAADNAQEKKQETLEKQNEEFSKRLDKEILSLTDNVTEQEKKQEVLEKQNDEFSKRLDKENLELTDKVTALEQKQTALDKKNEEIEEQLKNQQEDIQEKDKKHTEDVEQIKTDLEKVEKATSGIYSTKNVSFTARYHRTRSYTNGQTIIFDNVVNNDGSAYSPSTGVFTSPVAGKYLFSTTIMINGNNHADVHLMKNNNDIGRVIPYKTNINDRDFASVTAVVDLNKGDTAYVMFAGGKSSSSIYSGSYTSFTGVLIQS